MFVGNYEQMRLIALRIRQAALELGVKRIVVGECGHAWRVAYSFWNTLIGVVMAQATLTRSNCKSSWITATSNPCIFAK